MHNVCLGCETKCPDVCVLLHLDRTFCVKEIFIKRQLAVVAQFKVKLLQKTQESELNRVT